jgi:NAD(P)-dependent dehydrogenase (short-subunit alcohol dehydrogenase family)
MSIDLSGRVAIVTGGGRGIGRAEALALTAAGARVVVNDLGAECDGTGQDHGPADEVVAAIREAGGEAVANYGDVSLPSTGAALVQQRSRPTGASTSSSTTPGSCGRAGWSTSPSRTGT